jgi:predicted O-linked N-acetylglucosamine transferase (SPINDLY family)
MERVLFLDALPFPGFMRLVACADVCLDTLHFNGMNSSLEALALGIPIVTLPGRMQRGRHTQAMYRKMNIFDCIATDPAEYVRIAVRLGTDQRFAASIGARIRAASHLLFEDYRVIKEFERFFLHVCRPVA